MGYCRRFMLRRFLLLSLIVFLYYGLKRHIQKVQRVRYKANYQQLYECPFTTGRVQTIRKRTHLAYAGVDSSIKQQRVLLIKNSDSEGYIHIVDYLNYFKLVVRVETLISISTLPLQLDDVGRFSLIVFSDYISYERLPSHVKSRLQGYAQRFHVGIIYFALSECIGLELECYREKQASWLKFNVQSVIPFVARKNVSIDALNFQDWTFLSGDSWESVLDAENENGDSRSLVVHKRQPFEQVVIGYDLTIWPVQLAFIDIVGYFLGDSVTGDLTRYVQIDIDDIFVAQTGTRLVVDDVETLIQTQNDIRTFVNDFSFTLGFCGYYFKHGDSLESEADERMILNADKFLWFPHTFRHNHVHEYPAENLTIIMQMNKNFATEKQLNLLPNYAVSPQHSGVYPIHDALYESWKSIWNVTVTSTEEYPHFAPASKRRGFIYQNVSVLPRQTCGLFTRTLYFHAMPEGLKTHQDSIFGGSLFKSVLLNQFSIFMTHQQNFGNDRLGSYTFLNLFRFLKCYTNLRFDWVRPSQLAEKYFARFPNERQLLYTDICADIRHLYALPFDQTCINVSRLPNMLIVGPQKTGTTAIREFLLLHPNVSSNQDVGLDYFEEAQFFAGSNYAHGLNWYRQLFNGSNTTIVLEKSANYFDNPRTPEAVFHLIPHAKIVIILIDPADRAFSWYQHMKAHSNAAALKYSAEEIFSGKIDSQEVRKLRNRCLQPGFYAKHLERWLDYFAPSQLIVLDGAMIKKEPAKVMNSLILSLGLSVSIDYEHKLKFDRQKGFFCVNNNRSVRCLGKSKGRKYEPMSIKVRNLLNKIFAKPNKSLLDILRHYKLQIPSFLMSTG